jgi:flagellar M-ring protein FliF
VQQLALLWNALDTRKRLTVAGSAVTVFVLVLLLARMAGAPSYALLYAGLEPSVAGEIVGALEQRGVSYKVEGNGIYVDTSERDLLRISLAEQGLPASGSAGYELLDNLSGFGTTAQMFDAAYWRAKEGELARTILAWPQVKAARVHIATPANKPFGKSGTPVASVTIRLSSGELGAERARALRYLIASAVSGLSPEDVSVIDSDQGLITDSSQPGRDGTNGASTADRIRQNVERLVAARVGVGNAVVEVFVDTDTEAETIVERRFDPEGRVAISTDTEEVSGNSTDTGSGAVTVASNLPEGDATGTGSSAKSVTSETRERVNYEVSEVTRELVRQPGRINRISVAVLVNGLAGADTGTPDTAIPRSEEELQALEDLVKSAIGFNAERGDLVTIRSLNMPIPPVQGTLAEASLLDDVKVNASALIQMAILAVVTLVMGLFVLRPILANPTPLALPEPQDPDILDIPAIEAVPDQAEQALLASGQPSDPVSQLRQLIAERQDETVEVLRNWIESDEEETA